MNYPRNIISTFLFTATLASCAGYSLAEDVRNEDEQQQTNKNTRDGYYLSIGAGYRNLESPLRKEINGLQVVFNGGYNFYSTDHWNLDLIGAITDGRLELNYQVDGEARQISSDPTRGVGFRALGSWGNTVLQLVALPYVHEDFQSNNAIDYASLWLGHRWQIKNWSVNGLVGAKYRSSNLTNYQVVVDERLVNAYQLSSGVDYTAQIDLTYPISKNVLFQIYSKHTQFSDESLNNPLTKLTRKWENRPEKEHEFGILFNYVF
jgi:MipA family protein